MTVTKWPVNWDFRDEPYEHFARALKAANERAREWEVRQQVRRVRLRAGWRWVVQCEPRAKGGAA